MHSLPPDVSHPLRTAPCLLDVVRERIRARHYSPRTERAYVGWIRRFILFHNKRHPRDMGESEVVAFLSALATTGHVSASTQNQALSALVFLYSEVIGNELDWLGGLVRARRPARIPVVLTRQEVQALLSQLTGSVSLMASLLYGAGLRLLECAELRVKDVDFEAGEIRVRDGKGRKDRVTMVPASLVGALRQHLERVKALHEKFPIPDRGVPASRESVASLASDIVDALDTGKNVAVHCRQGIGRSGLIVGGVLMAAGKELGAALKAIRESRGLEIPETEEQRRWLSDFASWLVSTQAAQHLSALPSSRAQIFSIWSSNQGVASTVSDSRQITAFPFSAVFVSSAGSHHTLMSGWIPTPIEALASRREAPGIGHPWRPRNSFGPSYRPPHDERRRRSAFVIARLGGGAAHPMNACAS